MIQFIHSNDLTIYATFSTSIDTIYTFGKAICSLLILILIIAVVFELKHLWSKLLLTALALNASMIHYATLAMVSSYLKVRILPFVLIEINDKVGAGSLSVDHGQILTLFIIIMWRRELGRALKPALTTVKSRFKKVFKAEERCDNTSER